MATSMRKKFDKYQRIFQNMNMLMYVGQVLDTRYKMKFFEFSLESIYAHESRRVVELSVRVKSALNKMYDTYIELEK